MLKENLEKVSEIEKFEAFNDGRSLITIATFIDGFAVGWKMAISEAFKNALDIVHMSRVFGSKKRDEVTQGKNFNFKKGDILYDTREAYKLWSEAIKKIKLCVTVLSATPTTVIKIDEYETMKEVLYQKNGKKVKTAKKFNIKKTRIKYGTISFRISRPNSNKTKLINGEVYETNQENFVYFLQSGILRTSSKEILTII